jgi:hypothetical protein
MPDYKSMYYHLASKTATAVEVLDANIKAMTASIKAITELKEQIIAVQQVTEEMFINGDNGDLEED